VVSTSYDGHSSRIVVKRPPSPGQGLGGSSKHHLPKTKLFSPPLSPSRYTLQPQESKMPFFTRREPEEQQLPPPEPHYEEEPRRAPGGFLASLRRDPSPTPTTSTQATDSTRRTSSTYRTSPTHSSNDGSSSIFSRSTSTRGGRGGLLRKFGADEELDPSIVQNWRVTLGQSLFHSFV
jgi:hypothetical protein